MIRDFLCKKFSDMQEKFEIALKNPDKSALRPWTLEVFVTNFRQLNINRLAYEQSSSGKRDRSAEAIRSEIQKNFTFKPILNPYSQVLAAQQEEKFLEQYGQEMMQEQSPGKQPVRVKSKGTDSNQIDRLLQLNSNLPYVFGAGAIVSRAQSIFLCYAARLPGRKIRCTRLANYV